MTTDEAMDAMDAWVRSRGNGLWVDPDKPPGCTTPIQQVREELWDLVEFLLPRPRRNCLEIGQGEFGGTHVLWRMLFDEVTCVEIDPAFVEGFRRRETLDERSRFIVADSLSRVAMREATTHGPYDFLHVDGNHDYWAVRNDWEAYSGLVRSGGAVALHDLLTPGVSRLVSEIERTYIVRRVVHSTHVGLAIVEVP